MLVGLEEILRFAEERKCAIPAFNVYNMETVMGVLRASDATRAPVILQVYCRLFDSGNVEFLAPVIVHAAHAAKAPVAFHLDHGASVAHAAKALRYGVSSVMIDGSGYPLKENIALTETVVRLCAAVGVAVEGELGHVGSVNDDAMATYTEPDEAAAFVRETKVKALAVMVGTAHGRYQREPRIDVGRVGEIAEAAGVPLVLHGGSGVPDAQVRAAIAAGIRKVNFGTDLCYAFMDAVRGVPESTIAVDAVMEGPIAAVQDFAIGKIRLTGL